MANVCAANLLDLSYIASNLRPEDRREIECQLPDASALSIAAISLRDYAFVVEVNGNPEAAFGAAMARPDASLWVAWSWATRRVRQCLPVMVEFITGHLQPLVYEAGAHRVEARALASNVLAQRFIARIGGHRRCVLPAYGSGGEDFILYDWTRESWRPQGGDDLLFRHSINPAA